MKNRRRQRRRRWLNDAAGKSRIIADQPKAEQRKVKDSSGGIPGDLWTLLRGNGYLLGTFFVPVLLRVRFQNKSFRFV